MSPSAPRPLARRMLVVMATALAMLVSLVAVTPLLPAAHAAGPLISQGKPVTASSVENAGTPAAANAVDGNAGTRWASAFADPQWIQVDLGAHGRDRPGGAQLGGRVRPRVPDPDLRPTAPPGRRLLHDHRHRRRRRPSP